MGCVNGGSRPDSSQCGTIYVVLCVLTHLAQEAGGSRMLICGIHDLMYRVLYLRQLN